jgi:hypothetical protein
MRSDEQIGSVVGSGRRQAEREEGHDDPELGRSVARRAGRSPRRWGWALRILSGRWLVRAGVELEDLEQSAEGDGALEAGEPVRREGDATRHAGSSVGREGRRAGAPVLAYAIACRARKGRALGIGVLGLSTFDVAGSSGAERWTSNDAAKIVSFRDHADAEKWMRANVLFGDPYVCAASWLVGTLQAQRRAIRANRDRIARETDFRAYGVEY